MSHLPLRLREGKEEVIILCHMPITCLSCVCHITLGQESREVVVFRLLDKIVATELVSPTVQSKVLPYVQRHGLNVDEVLLQYVKVGSEYEKGGCSLVPGLRQLLGIKSWMGLGNEAKREMVATLDSELC